MQLVEQCLALVARNTLGSAFVTESDQARTERRLAEIIDLIWQTDEQPAEARTSFDEMEHVLFFFTDVIYRALPVFYESLGEALVEQCLLTLKLLRVPPPGTGSRLYSLEELEIIVSESFAGGLLEERNN